MKFRLSMDKYNSRQAKYSKMKELRESLTSTSAGSKLTWKPHFYMEVSLPNYVYCNHLHPLGGQSNSLLPKVVCDRIDQLLLATLDNTDDVVYRDVYR